MKPSDLTTDEYFNYYKQYVDLVDDIPLIEALQIGRIDTAKFFETIPEVKLLFQYSEGKWTPKEILLHLIDVSLEGFDENEFGKNCNANDRSMDDLLKEYIAVRTATIYLFESFSDSVLTKGGMANNNSLSVRACGFIICGHEKHHRKIIEERYL